MAGSASSSFRAFAITAADTNGRPVAATIRIHVNGLPAGSLQLNSEHSRCTITLPNLFNDVVLEAEVMEQNIVTRLTPDDSGFDFIFRPDSTPFRMAYEPEAGVTCPDGSKGSPCATCRIGGLDVRICV